MMHLMIDPFDVIESLAQIGVALVGVIPIPIMIVWVTKIFLQKVVMDKGFLLFSAFAIIFGLVYLSYLTDFIFNTTALQIIGVVTFVLGLIGLGFYVFRWLGSIGRNPQ